jgi:PAS domain S-box-containing protein
MKRPDFLRWWRRKPVRVVLPTMTVIAIVLIVALDVAFALRERQLLTHIQQHDYPDLLISRDLQQLMPQLQRDLQDAVAAKEPERLTDADRVAGQIVQRMSTLALGHEEDRQWTAEKGRFSRYYALARSNCERLMVAAPDESMAAAFERMREEYRAVASEIDVFARRQEHEVQDAFVQARRFQSQAIFGTLIITVLSTVMLGWLAMATTTRSLNQNLSLLQSTFESTLDGILAVDRIGNVQWLNRRFVDLFGMDEATLREGTDEETLFGRILGSLSSSQGLVALLEAFRRKPESVGSDVIHLKDGRIIECAFSPQWLEDEPIGRVWNFRDITTRTTLEAQLEQAQRVASLGRLAATVAHEFNNVLMGIQMSSEVIQKKMASHPELQPTMGRLAAGVQRGKRVTQEILRFTQPADPVLQRFDVGEWIRGVGEEIRLLVGPRVKVTVEVPVQRLFLTADPAQLVQVLTNLSLNARDAMPGGGELIFRVRRADAGDPRFASLRERDENLVEIEVRDSGPGIPPEILSHIFEPLFTTKKSGGTGLGLAVAHQVLARHGGLILVETTIGIGTTFRLVLPMGLSQAPTERGQTTIPVSAIRRILIVEDEVAVATGLSLLLEMEDIEVRIVERGSEAISAIEEFRPEILLLDVGLPDVDGVELGKRIAERWPDLPILFSTGHADPAAVEEANFHGVVGVLLKPYSAETLLAELARLASLRVAMAY